MSIKRATVVGCGRIGSGWAACFLAGGLTVTCTDPAEDAAPRLREALVADLAMLRLDAAATAEALTRVSFEADLGAAVRDAEWVQENAPERLDLKRDLLVRLDRETPVATVIASSTSSLKPSVLQEGLAHPERVLTAHPFLPVTLVPLVEVAGGALTAPHVVDAAMAFYRSIGKAPIRLRREMTGHIANRLQAAVMREAFYLLQQGAASAGDIDLAMTEGLGPRWAATGPLVSHHLAGGGGDRGVATAFSQLSGAMRAFFDDLGEPELGPGLERQVEDGVRDILDAVPEGRWREARTRIAHAVAAEKARPDGPVDGTPAA